MSGVPGGVKELPAVASNFLDHRVALGLVGSESEDQTRVATTEAGKLQTTTKGTDKRLGPNFTGPLLRQLPFDFNGG